MGFRSLDLTLPWLATAAAGVNQAGVAVAHLAAPPAPLQRRSSAEPDPLLLVQECLQRFEDLAACLDWCAKRPASGRARLFITDASGEGAIIAFDGSESRVEIVDRGAQVSAGEAGGEGAARIAFDTATRSVRVESQGETWTLPVCD